MEVNSTGGQGSRRATAPSDDDDDDDDESSAEVKHDAASSLHNLHAFKVLPLPCKVTKSTRDVGS